MKINDVLLEYYDVEKDRSLKRELSDKRRPRITFRHLQKLRKMRELKAIEEQNHSVFVSTMYKNNDQTM